MIDLHMHSTHSDGTDSVIDILKKAQEKKLTCISITDHNTCSAYKELKQIDIQKYYSGKIVAGIELNTAVLGVPIEILGYNLDTELLEENIKGLYLTSEQRNYLELERVYKKCLIAGVKMESNFLENYSPEMYVSEYLHKVLTKNEENRKLIDNEAWDNNIVLYRKYMSDPGSVFFVDVNDKLPSLKETIELVKKSNGKVFLPHIFEYKHNARKILENILENYEIDGIECYYTTFTESQTQELLRICKNRNLFISGGSDYHGLNSPGTEMGIGKGNLNIDDNIVLEWGKDINGKNIEISMKER